MKKIFKLKAQIKILNKKLDDNDTKNVYAIKNKIKELKKQLQIEMDNHYWENYLSI
jgi:hypothetical protein